MPKQEADREEHAEEPDVPASKESQAVAARQEQSKSSKRATIDMLRSKKPREKEIEFYLNEDDPVTILLRAIPAQEYDKLLSKHPPTPEQRVQGSSYNLDTFAPALLSRVVVDPELDPQEWAEIWSSSSWSQGELSDLFGAAASICVAGFQVPLS